MTIRRSLTLPRSTRIGRIPVSASRAGYARRGRTALLGTALTFVLTSGLALSAMWLLPHRATAVRELLPGALLVTVGHQLVQIAVIL
jgi:hypothetical protein